MALARGRIGGGAATTAARIANGCIAAAVVAAAVLPTAMAALQRIACVNAHADAGFTLVPVAPNARSVAAACSSFWYGTAVAAPPRRAAA